VKRLFGAMLVAFASTLVLAAPVKSPKQKSEDLLLPEGFPPVPEAHRTLASVPFEPGAAAVVLLKSEQHQLLLESDSILQRVHVHRRVKILNPAGAERFGNYEEEFYGRWRLQRAEARTVLPDGTIVDATSGIHREQSKGTTHESEINVVRVAWPQVQPGAILDLYYAYVIDEVPGLVWRMQESLPILDVRLTVESDPGYVYSTLGMGLTQEQTDPRVFRSNRGVTQLWRWTDIPSYKVEAFAPPPEAGTRQLVVYPREYRGGGSSRQWAVDWPQWTKEEFADSKSGWIVWMKRKTNAAEPLAREATAGKATTLEKVEAVRKALRERVRVWSWTYGATAPSPDDVLAQAAGTPVEIAATAVAMLRAVEVPAEIVVFRRRGSGPIPLQVPLPVLLDAALVRVPAEGGPIYADPTGDAPAGPVPLEARGVHVVPLDGKTAQPVKLPDLAAEDNRVASVVRGTVDATGRLAAEGTFSFFGLSAERVRARLRALDAKGREEFHRDWIREFMPGATVDSLAIEGLDGDADLRTVVRWAAESYGVPAGKRLLVNLSLFDRLRPADWASDERVQDLWFGEPFERADTLTIEFPEGATLAVPDGRESAAPPLGSYAVSQSAEGRTVTRKRVLRIELGRLPAAAYPGVVDWFRTIAKADDEPVVATLP
jgi:transglutaminase-like putative cysteine protease